MTVYVYSDGSVMDTVCAQAVRCGEYSEIDDIPLRHMRPSLNNN